MKKLVIISISIFVIISNCLAQQQTAYYYFNGMQIPLQLRGDMFTLYFHRKTIDESMAKSLFPVVKEVRMDAQKADSLFAFVTDFKNNNYSQATAYLKSLPYIWDVEPVVADDSPVPISNLFYVKLHSNNDLGVLYNMAASMKIQVVGASAFGGRWYTLATNKYSSANSLNACNLFWESGKFAAVDPGFAVEFFTNSTACPTDSNFSRQWGMPAINACKAWKITTGDTSIKVAVIDAGIHESHKEFSNTHITVSYNARNNTYPAVAYGDHGSHVGGIIFADHNHAEIAGIAPNASMINISADQSMGPGEYTFEHYAWCIKYAVRFGADIINNSWGSHWNWPVARMQEALDTALLYGRDGKGCVVVFASGNDATGNNAVFYPANTAADILVVGSVDSTLLRSSFSCYGSELDVVAPGRDIYSCIRNNQYAIGSGTSMAAPHVAGVAALMLSVNPNLTVQEVNHIIKTTVQKVNSGTYDYAFDSSHPGGTWNNEMGHGLVDTYQAVLMATNPPTNPDLWLRDNAADNGCEPNTTSSTFSSSPDIWLTDQYGDLVSEPAVGQTYTVHARVSNRSAYTSTAATLTLSWGISKTGFSSDSARLKAPRVCGNSACGTIVSNASLGNIAAGATAEYTFSWTVPNPSTEGCNVNVSDPWRVAIMARIDDGNPTPRIDEGTLSADLQAGRSNNVAWRNMPLEFNGLTVIIKPLIPLFGAPATLGGSSSEPDAELTWLAADGTTLGTGDSLTITPTATTERYILEGYSPSLDAYGHDTITLHPRLGVLLAVNPNPASGSHTTIGHQLSETVTSATLQLVGPLGEVLLSQTIFPSVSSTTLDLQSIPSGQYQLRLVIGNALTDSRTLIVQ